MITILTPTYNRAHTLDRLYDSLLNQSSKKFKWLIVDDGSQDGTKSLVQSLINENRLSIDYIFQENLGKHVAINTGMKVIDTELVMVVDSDDFLTFNAIETIYKNWVSDKARDLCGMCFLKGTDVNTAVGNAFNENLMIDTYINVRINGSIKGDKAEVWKSNLLRNNPFPQFHNEKFLGEAMLWVQISRNCKMLFVNEIIYICEYLEGGLSQSGRRLRIQCPLGGMAHSKEFLSSEFNLKIRIKNALLFSCYSFFASKNIFRSITESGSRMLILLISPFGYLLYLYWRFKYS